MHPRTWLYSSFQGVSCHVILFEFKYNLKYYKCILYEFKNILIKNIMSLRKSNFSHFFYN